MKMLLNDFYHMRTLVVLAVVAATLKFLTDSVVINTSATTSIILGHIDPLAYGAFLTPILGAHSYMSKDKKNPSAKKEEYDNANQN